MTLEQAQDWLMENTLLFTTSQRFSPEQVDDFFAAYNALTGEDKQKTACGRCLLNMKARFRQEHHKLMYDMKSYPVYRTPKGTYTFKEYGKPVLKIKAINQSSADTQLFALRASDKKTEE